MFSRLFNSYLAILFLCICSISVEAQQISVMHYDGDAFTLNTNDIKVKYKKIVFGPLPKTDKILLKDNSSLKLINENNEICEITEEGEYDVNNLKFIAEESNSLFDKFCTYFHSFFVSHSSAESKSSYKNSIHAISRGALSPPKLDFPLDGEIPVTTSDITFSWSHSCEACQYVVTIYDLESRASVYAWTTKDLNVSLSNADQFLLPEKKYYWTVTISGQEMEYPISRIEIGKAQKYDTQIATLEKEISNSKLELSESTKAIYIMSFLTEQDLLNYAIYYGQQQCLKHPEDSELSDFVDRFWYDALINQ